MRSGKTCASRWSAPRPVKGGPARPSQLQQTGYATPGAGCGQEGEAG
jgi:hypothetical protein